MADNLPDVENWRIDPNQYLGHDFEDFQNILQAFSLTSPKGYLMMKSEVAKKLKQLEIYIILCSPYFKKV